MCDESAECPLCMEALEIDDHSFFPCTCGYQICRFCWHRIRTDENGLCPACRKQYPEDPAEFKPLTEDELQNIKKERKQKDVQRKQKAAENRKHLANVRVVQRNLVFVVGLSPRLADPEVLKKHEYFGKFGKIHKVVINQSTSYAGSQGPSASAYVTYVKPEDALRAILTVNNVHVEGRTLKTSLGTTKYCSHFLKGSHCQKSDCMYLHELGEEAASFTKDEMQAGKHQEYEQMLIEQFLNAQNSANNHHISNMKIKKSVSPQAIENPEVLPSLMDMTGDIKHSLPQCVPLLPNPVPIGSSGGTSNNTNGHAHLNNSGWPLLDSGPTTNGKSDHLSNGKVQKAPFRTNTPPGGGGGTTSSNRAVGSGRQRGSNSINSIDENLISSPNPMGSSRSLSSSPPDDEAEVSSHTPQPSAAELQQQQSSSTAHRGLPLPTPVMAENNTKSNGTASAVPSLSSPQPGSAGGLSPQQKQTTSEDSLSVLQPSEVHHTLDSNVPAGFVGAIGSNRRPGFLETDCTQGLSFFGSNLLGSPSLGTPQAPSTSASQDIPNVALTNQEMSDAIPVSSTTDWSAAFGFNQKEVPQDDDLGFDPCAESFKGLADLIEKENDMHQQQTAMGPPLHQQHSLPGLHLPQLTASPPHSNFHSSHTLAQQHSSAINTQHPPLIRSLPPGFSMSQIQQQQQQLQQQQQQFFRPELANSKMLELLPQFVPTHQRFPPHSFHSLPLDLQSQPQSQTTQQQHPQQAQNDLYSMKDMQDQLRSMLPNINISFGALPQQSQQQQQQQQPQASSSSVTSSSSSSLHTTQHSQQLNKSWPLSSSPDAWNDPAIVSTSQFTEPAGLFPESAPHWLKSLQQLTECDGPSHRLPFVQQFPLSGGWGAGPHHTHNPPPGFRTPGLPSQQTTDSHQMAEVLQ